jgi:hypothetical protein
MADSHWIERAHLQKGVLRTELGIPEGEDIPRERLEELVHSTDKLLAKRARLALTLERIHHD